ncbi:MAG TPA: hypothetical protein DIT89_08935 [Planctomycetaceae bacterium]|nr:hypothetical protein [Planctomycetaceae bacterium]
MGHLVFTTCSAAVAAAAAVATGAESVDSLQPGAMAAMVSSRQTDNLVCRTKRAPDELQELMMLKRRGGSVRRRRAFDIHSFRSGYRFLRTEPGKPPKRLNFRIGCIDSAGVFFYSCGCWLTSFFR